MRLRLRAERAVLLNALLKRLADTSLSADDKCSALISGRMKYNPKPTLCVVSIVAVFTSSSGSLFHCDDLPQIPRYALRRTVRRFLIPVRGLR
jgi:hypothetical protein